MFYLRIRNDGWIGFWDFINNLLIIYVFNKLSVFIVIIIYSHCMFMYDYPDWGFSMPFPQL
jgi:hypothetical protein